MHAGAALCRKELCEGLRVLTRCDVSVVVTAKVCARVLCLCAHLWSWGLSCHEHEVQISMCVAWRVQGGNCSSQLLPQSNSTA
jgi:hypothetical protein